MCAGSGIVARVGLFLSYLITSHNDADSIVSTDNGVKCITHVPIFELFYIRKQTILDEILCVMTMQ